jgi:voltage-gated potassium channel Kch
VFTELLDFEGDEMYFTTQPKLTGKTFFDAQLNFRTSAAIGLVTNDEIILNPPADRILHETDQIIVIAEDDTSIRLDEPGVPNSSQLNTGSKLKATPERTLVIGYNESLALILPELDSYVPKGSQVQVVSEYLGQISTKFKNISVSTEIGDTTSRARLEALDLNSFDHIIVLAYSEKLSPQRADAKTLITLLHLRDIAKQKGTTLNIVSEMMDDKNRQLAEVTDADDFIVSDKLVSLMLSQLSENARLAEVFEALFSSIGSEICLRPAELYIPLDQPVDFYTVLLAAKERGETAFGYRIQELAHKSEEAYGVVVNPDKTNSVTYSPGDKIIVLAEA